MITKSDYEIIRHLWAFFPHFWIYKRKCDFTNKDIISVFSKKSAYPVWHKDEWFEKANPPSAIYKKDVDFWQQVWWLFKTCPIAHNIWIWNENSEYTDDCWYSKNCYLCHSLGWSQDSAYSFRIIRNTDCMFCVFSFDLQKCYDVIYGFDSYNIKYAIDIKRCKNSAFLFDCQDCEDCFLCYNLRNKKFCIWNKQYSKQDYEKEISKYNLSSRKQYNELKQSFLKYITNNAWWKNLQINSVENWEWNYLDNCKDVKNCYLAELLEDCENAARSISTKKSKYIISAFDAENIYMTALAQVQCYNISYSFNVTESKNLEYCWNCFRCEDCFLCCWLVWKKYHILNKEYSKQDYEKLKAEISIDMKQKWIYGEFFPAYFSPSSYEETMSWVLCSLDLETQKKLWFNVFEHEKSNKDDFKDISELPDDICDTVDFDFKWWYYDDEAKRPFQISDLDITFSKKLWVPLNDKFYIRRLKENFSWMFPEIQLRETKCAKSWKIIKTALPVKLDWRILSIEEYEKVIY